jgi:GNAT superfamily N-acetyltransferase
MWKLHFRLSPEGRKRLFDDLVPLLDTAKSEVLGERNSKEYYLMYIGTKPSARGKGYARKLLEHMLEKVWKTFVNSTYDECCHWVSLTRHRPIWNIAPFISNRARRSTTFTTRSLAST